MDTKHLLGKRIKELRKRKKLSQEQLAEMVGFESSNSISNVENGYNYPSIQNLENVFTFEKYQDEDILRAEIERLLDEYPEKLQDFYKILKALTE